MLRSTPTAAAVLVAGAVVLVLVFAGGGGPEDHTINARLSAALQMAPGQEVRVAGAKVGEVERVRSEGGGAVVTFTVSDDAWPLSRDTRLRLRWGSTVPYQGRFVQLLPGREGGSQLADGDTLSGAQVSAPVEFDQVYAIVNRATRPRIRSLMQSLADVLPSRQPQVRTALDRSGRGVSATADLFDEIAQDQVALRTLVATGARATTAISREDPALRDLVTGAAGTFDEFAAQSAPIVKALTQAPGTLQRARGGLRRLEQSLPGLTSLVRDIGPGAEQLRVTAPVMRVALDRLTDVAPVAAQALRQARQASPQLTRLLGDGTPFLKETGAALRAAAPLVGCVRPYGPEIASFFGTWGGYTSSYDVNGHYSRIVLPVQPVPNQTPLNSVQTLKANPQIRYAFPRPPGLNVGQPWLQPQCGAGEDALNVAKDPEVTDPGADRG